MQKHIRPNGPENSFSMGGLDWGMLLSLSLLWGGSFFFVEVAIGELPPLVVVAVRVTLAALIMVIVVVLKGFEFPFRQRWREFLLMGILNNVIPFTLIATAQTAITSGLAAILNATTPIFTILLAHFLTRDEKLTSAKIIGVLVSFTGVIVMVGHDVLSGLGNNVLGQCAVLVAAISYGLAGIYGRRFKSLAPMSAASGQLVGSSLILLPIALISEQPWQLDLPSCSVLGALLGLAVISTALAYSLYFALLQRTGASNLLLVTFLIPISALALGVFVLNEVITPVQITGMCLICAGLVLKDGRLGKLFRKASNPI